MSSETFGPIELFLFLGTPLLLSVSALVHHLWTERPSARRRSQLVNTSKPENDGGHRELET